LKIKFSTCEKCRVCGSNNFETLLGFKAMPLLAEPIKSEDTISSAPLTVLNCKDCGYVFLKEVIDSSVYNDYIYTPQSSDDVVEYLRNFVRNAKTYLGLKTGQCGLEVGSGDGSLCREFNNAGIKFTGIEPSKILCNISKQKNNVDTYNDFFNIKLAEGIGKVALVVVRHVLEHIDDFSSFFQAIDQCLKQDGSLLIEVPYLGDIVCQKQFYAFFFEHLSYFSVSSLGRLLKQFGFYINRVEFVYPEGGSILVHATRKWSPTPVERPDFDDACLALLSTAFISFQLKFDTLVSEAGPIVAYGAGQRGITLLNLLGASNVNVVTIFDENPGYHGLYTPQSEIPVRSPDEMTIENVSGKVLILASSYDKQVRNKYKHMGNRFVSLSELA
jgi:novobiocin biosynthesis protein NovU/D-mycarose 3-C-methyltransferase